MNTFLKWMWAVLTIKFNLIMLLLLFSVDASAQIWIASTTSNLRLRDSPSIDGKVIRTIPKGCLVAVIDDDDDSDYCYCVYVDKDEYGYVAKKYLTYESNSSLKSQDMA